MVSKDIVEIIEELVKLLMPLDDVHGLGHVLRVRKLALELASEIGEDIDVEVLELASLLHDMGRIAGHENHAVVSAKIAELLLTLANYPREKIEKVVDAILSHSYSLGRSPKFIEGMILSDADKLDALGAIGVARVIAYGERYRRNFRASLEHFKSKILKLKEMLYTDVAKRRAEKLSQFVEEFVRQFESELESAKLNSQTPP